MKNRSLIESAITKIVKKVLKEESTRLITANIGGTKYQFTSNGHIKRLGSEKMDYGSDSKLIGAVTDYGGGNRHFTKSSIEISLADIFDDPEQLVGKYPVMYTNGKLLTFGTGPKESHHRVLWVK